MVLSLGCCVCRPPRGIPSCDRLDMTPTADLMSSPLQPKSLTMCFRNHRDVNRMMQAQKSRNTMVQLAPTFSRHLKEIAQLKPTLSRLAVLVGGPHFSSRNYAYIQPLLKVIAANSGYNRSSLYLQVVQTTPTSAHSVTGTTSSRVRLDMRFLVGAAFFEISNLSGDPPPQSVYNTALRYYKRFVHTTEMSSDWVNGMRKSWEVYKLVNKYAVSLVIKPPNTA